MAVLTWIVNHLALDKEAHLEKTLIANVQAGYIFAHNHADNPALPIILQSKQKRGSQAFSQPTHKPSDLHNRIVLHFTGIETQLDALKIQRLKNFLTTNNVLPAHHIQIFSGPVPTKNNTLSSQSAKLRAQAVARQIYTYTPLVKMYYQPQLPEGKVVIEMKGLSFYQSQ